MRLVQGGAGAIHTRVEFACELTRVRERAGLTVRQVAKAVGLPFSTVGGYFSGRHLPPVHPRRVLPDILAVCEVTDPAEVELWQAALARVRRSARAGSDTAAPYRGLSRFERDDADWFFGREDHVARLVAAVQDGAGQGAALAVLGASGSGKSSLLQAGLVPALGERWRVALTSPAQPVPELPYGEGPLLVLVDQFEELFSAVDDEASRRAYVDWVMGLPSAGVVVVLGLRADFFAKALRYPTLVEVLRDGQHLVGPMSREQVVRTITGPAARAGVAVEDGLLDLLLRDLAPALRDGAGDAAHEAGALPLLSHALLQTWTRGSRRTLAIADYVGAGGIEGAVAATAEAGYRALGPAQRESAKSIFLRLVHIGEGTADTRRRVGVDEFLDEHDQSHSVGETDIGHVLDVFVEQRLITADLDTVEITHEALLSAWPRLRAWLDEDREDLLTHRRLTAAAQQWRAAGDDPATAYRGVLLERALALRDTARHPLSPVEREFLAHSEEQASRERARRRRGTRRLRRLTAALAVLVVLAGVLGVDAVRQRAASETQRDLAVSRLLALRANTLLETDPALAGQLAVAAFRTAPTVEARSAVLSATRFPTVSRLLGPQGVVQSVATAADGELIAATGTDRRVWLWHRDPEGRYTRGQPLTGPAGELYAVAVSPDGRRLVAAGAEGVLHRWDLTDPQQPTPVLSPLSGPTAPVHALAFSPNGQVLAAGSFDHRVHLFATTDTARPRQELDLGAEVHAVRFSPDGMRLAAAGSGGAARIWPTTHLSGPGTDLPGASLAARAVAFSPDGRTAALANSDRTTQLWDVTDPTRPVSSPTKLVGHGSWVNAVAFSPDGQTVATGSSDNTVRLWDRPTAAVRSVLPHPGPVTALSYAERGRVLITAAGDGVVRVWRVPGPSLTAPGDGVYAVGMSADGTRLAAGTGGPTGGVHLIDTTDPTALRGIGASVSGSTSIALSGAADLSPDGSTVAAGHADGTIEAWDVREPQRSHTLGIPSPPTGGIPQALSFRADGALLAAGGDDRVVRLFDMTATGTAVPVATLTGPTASVYGVAFNRDGTVVAGASVDKSVWLWDIHDPRNPQVLSIINGHTNYAYSAAFSPTADLLVTGSADRTLKLWDITDPRTPHALGDPLTGPAGPIITTTISADGRLLAAGGKDRQIWLWTIDDPRRPALFAALSGATSDIYSLDFTPDGTAVAVGSADHTTSLLATSIDTAIDRICSHHGDRITEQEWITLAPDVPFSPPC
ncbi:MAG: helix-turn-helix domain-containing protein [Actinomycetota bacterium]|nr:helix-turn-helix domain-containing protein [Actinomycetota bacterium]